MQVDFIRFSKTVMPFEKSAIEDLEKIFLTRLKVLISDKILIKGLIPIILTKSMQCLNCPNRN